MKILLRASNLFLFLMQISVHFDVRILHSRLRGSLLTQINRKIVIRLHWRAADLDVVSLAQPDGCCWSANFQSAKQHRHMRCIHQRPLFNVLLSAKVILSSRFPFATSMRTTSRRSRWRTTKMNVSVSSVMHRTDFYTSCSFHLQEFWHTPHARTSVARRMYTISCCYSRTHAT